MIRDGERVEGKGREEVPDPDLKIEEKIDNTIGGYGCAEPLGFLHPNSHL